MQQRGDEEAKPDTEADGRNVIQEEMQVREVHEMNSMM